LLRMRPRQSVGWLTRSEEAREQAIAERGRETLWSGIYLRPPLGALFTGSSVLVAFGGAWSLADGDHMPLAVVVVLTIGVLGEVATVATEVGARLVLRHRKRRANAP
jgi:hypothetical protein